MTSLQVMEDFFFYVLSLIPAFLMSEPVIYFVSILFGVCVAGLMVTLTHLNRR